MEITKNSIIGDVLDQYPDTAELFFSICMVHGADADALVADLNKAIA